MNENKFDYTYKAPTERERKTIENIKSQYEIKELPSSAYQRVVSLDKKIKKTATCISIILGTIGTLIFGLGLTCVLEWGLYVWGIIIAVVGAIPTSLAFFAYNSMIKRGKKKYGEEILRLSSEILEKED